jgi:type IV pilus assembly protein PilO
MNLLEQIKTMDPRSLDPRDPGRWPGVVRAFCVFMVFALCTGVAWYFLVWDDDRPVLLKSQQEELDLRAQFENKQQRAANLAAYKSQLGEMERTFGAMLRQLPGRTEVPNLLVDISQSGLAALPIKIRLVGSYHQFGAFVSGIAALPRIVTLHDIEIKPLNASASSFDNLTMDVTAKTYRYIEDESADGSAKSAKPKSGGPT